MNNQEAFDIVVKHLRKQGKRAQTEDGQCRYRGDEGTKCAVGCLIPDEMYKESMEGHDAAGLLKMNPEVKSHLRGINVDLLLDLQELHDSCPISIWEEHLEGIAIKRHLTMSPLEVAA